jgi:hypothetical protein
MTGQAPSFVQLPFALYPLFTKITSEQVKRSQGGHGMSENKLLWNGRGDVPLIDVGRLYSLLAPQSPFKGTEGKILTYGHRDLRKTVDPVYQFRLAKDHGLNITTDGKAGPGAIG